MLPKKMGGIAAVVLLTFLIILAGGSKVSLAPSSGKRTITLGRLGVAFEVPVGFAVFQWETDEGVSYRTSITIGREFRPGYLKHVPITMEFNAGRGDCVQNSDSNKPNRCIEAEFERVNEEVRRRAPGYRSNPEYTEVFGNKGVRYTRYTPIREIIILGYIRKAQLPDQIKSHQSVFSGQEGYLARLTITHDIPQPAFDKADKNLIDTVVNSLRVMK